MSEMVERVARALFEKSLGTESRLTWSDLTPGQPDHAGWMGVASAAIAAMREPTEAMHTAGEEQFMCRSEDVFEIWRAMIDAALKD